MPTSKLLLPLELFCSAIDIPPSSKIPSSIVSSAKSCNICYCTAIVSYWLLKCAGRSAVPAVTIMQLSLRTILWLANWQLLAKRMCRTDKLEFITSWLSSFPQAKIDSRLLNSKYLQRNNKTTTKTLIYRCRFRSWNKSSIRSIGGKDLAAV